MMDFDRREIGWAASETPISYPAAVSAMEARAAQIHAGAASELVWLLEHPPLYTAGTSANPADLKAPDRFPVFQSGRGGQYTYHGPGQRIAYVMLDVKSRFGADVRAFVAALEHWLIDALAAFGVKGAVRPGRVGVWVIDEADPSKEAKIAAVGIRIRRSVSFHGVSLNVDPDLTHYGGIVPCGISDHGVTSLAALGRETAMKSVDSALRAAFERQFGPTALARAPIGDALAPAPTSNS